ncbi:alpha/beta hydrolase [Williamsia sp. CHRR-6]|uniref:alpha/beta hydrolase n=1 Tax=Williamsia sp. CHRR-6 TaxID=2835871 RepID=UPI001BD9322D|nr:alpha/beta hydrolase [Williamsia sp. CHRR-6]MBT0566300.1 alpha/beta hydrolase [Williamsia sp. CHRR-6]
MSSSLRSRVLVSTTSLWLRPLAERVPATPAGVRFARGMVATGMRLGGDLPRGTQVDRIHGATADGRTVRGEWVRGRTVTDRTRVILYVHGSAYAICSAATHRSLVARLSRVAGIAAFTVDYRLAPEHRFPAAADDVRAAYTWLLESGYAPGNILLAGDSAGGHLIVDLIAENARAGLAQPGAALLMSPLFDLTLELAARRERIRRDPMISAAAARRLVAHYTDGHASDSPRLKLSLSQGMTLPPMLIQAGGAEMLRADAHHLAEAVRAVGGRAELQIWPGQMHVFQAFDRLIPEAQRAVRAAGRFLAETTIDAVRRSA